MAAACLAAGLTVLVTLLVRAGPAHLAFNNIADRALVNATAERRHRDDGRRFVDGRCLMSLCAQSV